MSADVKNPNNVCQEIIELVNKPGTSFESLALEFLELGKNSFQMDLAIVSEVEEDSYFVYAVADNSMDISKGAEIPLGDTLCRAVFENKKTITYFDMGKESHLAQHPIYTEAGLRSYMGAPIWLGRKLFGTLNFSTTQARTEPFSEYELSLLEMMATFLSKQLEIDLHGQTMALMMKNLTHELRSPLNGILGSTEILNDTELDQEQFELLDLIKRSAENLEATVTDLSLFIKVNKDFKGAGLVEQYPVELTKEVLKVCSPKLKRQNIFLYHSEDKCSNLVVSPALYKASIKAILAECESRAKERKELSIRYQDNGRYFQVVITDNGPRLTENVVKVLNTFGRIEFSQNSFSTQGINLNLSLASILVQLAGGHLRVETIKKEDNQFVLSFPII